MATAWPLQSQSLVSALQLPEPAVEKSSWLITYLFFDLLPMLGNYCPSSPPSVWLCDEHPKLVQAPCTRNHQGGGAHSHNCKDGWERVREEFFSLWKHQSKFKALHQQWNSADLQAVIQSDDESQNTNASAKAGFNFCTSRCILYWQKK